mmetsp:Transcript_63055/g.163778  ORF Transcript_63055/g.163778 Transcript_63055/m.163778 type:complete len:248 (-) Transcript_63055:216-959(-)
MHPSSRLCYQRSRRGPWRSSLRPLALTASPGTSTSKPCRSTVRRWSSSEGALAALAWSPSSRRPLVPWRRRRRCQPPPRRPRDTTPAQTRSSPSATRETPPAARGALATEMTPPLAAGRAPPSAAWRTPAPAPQRRPPALRRRRTGSSRLPCRRPRATPRSPWPSSPVDCTRCRRRPGRWRRAAPRSPWPWSPAGRARAPRGAPGAARRGAACRSGSRPRAPPWRWCWRCSSCGPSSPAACAARRRS